MVTDPTPTCRDFQDRLDEFLDGESDSSERRRLVMHSNECAACAEAVERAERVKHALERTVESEVARLDAAKMWSAIESRLEAPKRPAPRPWRIPAVRDWIPVLRLPALAMSGALVALLGLNLFSFWFGDTGGTGPVPLEIADNHAQIERIESSEPHVAVWSEPGQQTTAIWVASFEP